jgi:hypothetical protein
MVKIKLGKKRVEAPIFIDYTAHFTRNMVENGTQFAKKRNENGALKTKAS